MEQELFSRLKQQLSEAASSVGFRLVGPAKPIADAVPPANTFIWESSFAVLAAVPLEEQNAEALQQLVGFSREWMWRRLISDERLAKFIDGYLLFALSGKPDSELRAAARETELDTSTCRKHVIWPVKKNDWSEQLWGVTVLGLPRRDSALPPPVEMPELPESARQCLDYYDESKSYLKAAEMLKEQAARMARKEISNAS